MSRSRKEGMRRTLGAPAVRVTRAVAQPGERLRADEPAALHPSRCGRARRGCQLELDPPLEPVAGDDGDVLRMRLAPETGLTLPDGLGSVTFDGWSRWVKLQISETPGNTLTLVALLVAVAGLCVSLFVRPRRLFVRVGGDVAVVGGLDRTDTATGLEDEVGELVDVVAGVRPASGDEAQWNVTTSTRGAGA